MSFLQHRNTHKQFIVSLVIGITIVHLALLGSLFFLYRDTIEHIDLTILPLMRSHEIEFRVAQYYAPSGAAKATQAQKSSETKSPKAAARLTEIAPAKAPKKETAKKAAQKEIKKPAAKKAEKIVPKVEKKSVKEPEKPVHKIIEKKEEVIANQSIGDHLNIPVSKEGALSSDLVFFEAEYKALYENLSDHWAPPAGVPADAQCVITIVLDTQGMIDEMLVDQSSGMLVFDIAARSALSDVEFPRFVWGKSMTVTFSV